MWTDETKERAKALWQDGWTGAQIAAELGIVSRSAVIGMRNREGWLRKGETRKPPQPKRSRPYKPLTLRPLPQPRERDEGDEPRDTVTRPTNHGTRFDVVQNRAPEPLLITDEPLAPAGQRCRLLDLHEDTCRWPIGDPRDVDFRFCGGKPIVGLPYCEHHCRVSYRPVADRRGDTSAPRR